MNLPPIDESGGNVTVLPKRKRPRPDAALEIVHSYKCQHGHFLVDEKKAEVECGLCHEKLSPMWVLSRLAQDDARLRERWAHMKAEVQLLAPKLRTKCQHCNQMTRIPSNVKEENVRQLAYKILRDEA